MWGLGEYESMVLALAKEYSDTKNADELLCIICI